MGLLVGLTATAAAAQPVSDPVRRDLRCILALSIAAMDAAGEDDKLMRGTLTGVAGYLGRVQGREPGIDLRARLTAEVESLKPQWTSEAKRCGREMEKVADFETVRQVLAASAKTPPR